MSNTFLYDEDYCAWLQNTVDALKSQKWSDLDLPNLIEEMESMGRAEKNALKSNLVIVLVHLLKWYYQPTRRSDSWLNSITEHRRRMEFAIEDSPSLRPYLEQVFENCYLKARRDAAVETRLPETTFPDSPPFTIDEALNSKIVD